MATAYAQVARISQAMPSLSTVKIEDVLRVVS
jgi:hypothetical protein